MERSKINMNWLKDVEMLFCEITGSS